MFGVYLIIMLLIYLFLTKVISKFVRASKALAEDQVDSTIQKGTLLYTVPIQMLLCQLSVILAKGVCLFPVTLLAMWRLFSMTDPVTLSALPMVVWDTPC